MLILEDSRVLAALLLNWMASVFPDKHVSHVSTIADACDLINQVNVDICLVDLNLPDGNGMEFIRLARERFPESRHIIMTNPVTAREVKSEVDLLGPVCFFEKPVDLGLLESVIRPIIEPSGQVKTGFSAAIQNTDPLSILQLKCLARTSVTIEFLNVSGEVGRVFVDSGAILRAETASNRGIPALAEMISWKEGAARELPPPEYRPQDEIKMGWESALLEASRMVDEASLPRA